MKRPAVLVLSLLLVLSPLAAQKIKRMEFRNQPIPDILLALAQSAGVSIIPDETVKSGGGAPLAKFLGKRRAIPESARGLLRGLRVSISVLGSACGISQP